MSEVFLDLSKKEKSQILTSLSTNPNINRNALLLEKDIWICWALEHLFRIPNHLPMAFKGGTSLSKAFHLIDRFSEDIDITIDYKSLNCGNPLQDGISNTKKKAINDELREKVTEYIKITIMPHYENIITNQFNDDVPTIELDNDGETLYLRYPSVLNQKSGYITDSIRIEFGGRNLVTPSESHVISTDIAKHMESLSFPQAKVIVLSPQKTFWEKCTLIHYECNRKQLKEDANRISRHWYDISRMTASNIGNEAIINRKLLEEVIKIKKAFYNSSFAKYDDCLNGNLRLTPNNEHLKLLKYDFEKMIDNKMFYNNNPNFDQIINDIRELEEKINDIRA